MQITAGFSLMMTTNSSITAPGIGPNPLAGANIVVTRPSATAAPLKRAIHALGGAALNLPALALKAPENPAAAASALRSVQNYDAVIFISPSAVRFAYAIRPDLRFSRRTRLYSVGNTTARALQRHVDRDVEWPRNRQNSEGLLELPALGKMRGRRAAIIGAPGGRELLIDELRSRGAETTAVHVYRRTAPSYSRRHLAPLEQAQPPLITLLTSGEALVNLGAQLPLHLFTKLAAGELIVSSKRLADAARKQLFKNIHIAESATPSDLMSAACALMTQNPPNGHNRHAFR